MQSWTLVEIQTIYIYIYIYIYIHAHTLCAVEINKKGNNLEKPQNAGDVSTAIQMNS
jgi:hypothetical protein